MNRSDAHLCPALGPPVQDVLPVLVHLQLHDGHLQGYGVPSIVVQKVCTMYHVPI